MGIISYLASLSALYLLVRVANRRLDSATIFTMRPFIAFGLYGGITAAVPAIAAGTRGTGSDFPGEMSGRAIRTSGPVDPHMNLVDGSANAPTGTPQLPNLLGGYAVRPTWNVAAVDYAVGVPAGTALSDPSTINLPGVSVDASSHSVTISGNGVTVSGYDFSRQGGWTLNISGANDTVQNCNFAVGTNHNELINAGNSASNVTIIANTINGNGTINGFIGQGLINLSAAGTNTVEYNSILNAYSEDIVTGSGTSSGNTIIVKYNLIGNAGMGWTSGAHGDWIQHYNSAGAVTNSYQIEYNTFIQTVSAAQGHTQGLSLQSANIQQGAVLSETVTNNSFLVPAADGGNLNYAVIVDTTNLNGTAMVSNNFADLSGDSGARFMFAGNYNGKGVGKGAYKGAITKSNNFIVRSAVIDGARPQSGVSNPARPRE